MATLAQIRSRLDSWIDRTDSAYLDNRDLFINMGIRWLARKLRDDSGFDEVWTNSLDVTTGVDSILFPRDWRPTGKTRVFLVIDGKPKELKQIPLDFLTRTFWDEDKEVEVKLWEQDPGEPEYFAIRGRTADLRPVADDSYTIRLEGIEEPDELILDSDFNVLTEEAEDAVLFSALREAWDFFEDSTRAHTWERRALEAGEEWKNERRDSKTASYHRQMGTYDA